MSTQYPNVVIAAHHTAVDKYSALAGITAGLGSTVTTISKQRLSATGFPHILVRTPGRDGWAAVANRDGIVGSFPSGSSVVIVTMATCGYCHKLLSELRARAEELKSKHISIVVIPREEVAKLNPDGEIMVQHDADRWTHCSIATI